MTILNSESEPAFDINTTTTDIHLMLYHSLNVSQPVASILVSVYPQENETLDVYVQIDTNPTLDDFILQFQVRKK